MEGDWIFCTSNETPEKSSKIISDNETFSKTATAEKTASESKEICNLP